VLVDLGSAPLSNAYLTRETLKQPEKWYPLRVLVCETCWLVQTEDFVKAEDSFDAEYSYFSGFSTSWLAHVERYVADMADRFKLTEKSHVVEVAANDGSLLEYVKNRGIPCTGIEPTASTAAAARGKGISIIEHFFGSDLASQLASESRHADLIVANNVLGHVPDINDFVTGFRLLLKPDGIATFEFPHLTKLISANEFDTIYHEHFSYLSLTVIERIFKESGLLVFDVEEHETHGGSLRVFAQCADSGEHARSGRVDQLLECERHVGVATRKYYSGFQERTDKIKDEFARFLIESKRDGKTLVGYGAAAKGNTLMNYAGVRSDLIPFVVDKNPAKQGKFMPGSRIPIVSENQLQTAKPAYVVILPWNIAEEVQNQLAYVKEWGGKFVTAIPRLNISG